MKTTFIIIILLIPNGVLFSQNLEINFNVLEKYSDSENGQYLIGALDGVATDSENNLYLFDFIQNAVLKLDDEGKFIGKIIDNGRGPGQINSIYSHYLDEKNENIYISDRQNFRYMVTNLQGEEVRSYPINPNNSNAAMGMHVFNNNTIVLLYYNSQEQIMRRNEGIDSLIHFYDSDSFERLYSICDRETFSELVGYKTNAPALINKTFVGKITFTDPETLLISPYVFNKGVLVLKKVGPKKWTHFKTLESKDWDIEGFEEIDFRHYRNNRESYHSQGHNIVSSSNSDGQVAGIIKLRSAGIFTFENGLTANFIIREKTRDNTFFHELYVEMYSNNYNYLGSKKIYTGENNENLHSVSWMDKNEQFYLVTKTSRFKSEVIKFSLK